MSLQEVREYPQPPDPLQVALWRDQCLTLEEHRAVLHGMDETQSVSLLLSRLRYATGELVKQQQAVSRLEGLLQQAQENAARFSGPEYLHLLP